MSFAQFVCTKCKVSYATQSSLNRHTSYNSKCGTKSKDFVCVACDKAFVEHKRLVDHEVVCKSITSTALLKVSKSLKDEVNDVKIQACLAMEKYKASQLEVEKLTDELSTTSGQLEYVTQKCMCRLDLKYQDIALDDKLKMVQEGAKVFDDRAIDDALSRGKFTYIDFLKGVDGIVDFIMGMVASQRIGVPHLTLSYVCINFVANKFKRLVRGDKVLVWINDNKGMYINKVLEVLKPVISSYIDRVEDDLDICQTKPYSKRKLIVIRDLIQNVDKVGYIIDEDDLSGCAKQLASHLKEMRSRTYLGVKRCHTPQWDILLGNVKVGLKRKICIVPD